MAKAKMRKAIWGRVMNRPVLSQRGFRLWPLLLQVTCNPRVHCAMSLRVLRLDTWCRLCDATRTHNRKSFGFDLNELSRCFACDESGNRLARGSLIPHSRCTTFLGASHQDAGPAVASLPEGNEAATCGPRLLLAAYLGRGERHHGPRFYSTDTGDAGAEMIQLAFLALGTDGRFINTTIATIVSERTPIANRWPVNAFLRFLPLRLHDGYQCTVGANSIKTNVHDWRKDETTIPRIIRSHVKDGNTSA